MKILITGVAGFIGSNLAEKLIAAGYHITGLDNFDPFYSKDIKQRNLSGLLNSPAFRFVELDITSEALAGHPELADIDLIIHLAARAGVRPSIDRPMDYLHTNANGTLNLMEFARLKKIKRFIFASSSSVYGKNENLPWAEDSMELLPISPYAASKIAGEALGRTYSHLYNMEFVALRFFTVYGPRQRPDLAIHKFFNKIYKGEEIELYGNGETYRDYTYIDDTVKGIMSAIDSPNVTTGFNCFNLGNRYEVSLAHLLEQIQNITGIKAIVKNLPEQPGDVRHTCADISKSKKMLSYNPSISITEGLTRFNDWFKKEYGYNT